MSHNKDKEEASELEFLRYFYDQSSISVQERIYIEEGFELCFNRKVPKEYKIDLQTLMRSLDENKNNQNNKTPVMDEAELAKMLKQTIPAIPKAPKMPRVDDDYEIMRSIINATNVSDFEIIHKGSGEHVSLAALIEKLKNLTGMDND
jgi:hypothetical protein